MVQRIQSFFLLLASLSMFLLFFLPIAEFGPNPEMANAKSVEFIFNTYGLDYEQAFSDILDDLYPFFLKYTIILIMIVCIITPFILIFAYKNRSRQVHFSRLTLLLNVAMIIAFFLLSDFFAKETFSIMAYKIGIFVPILSVIFLLLAIRFIKKDEKLIRSADRIR